MSGRVRAVVSTHDAARGSKKTYVVGFVLSLLLTATAFALVRAHVAHHHNYPSDGFMMAALSLLAVTQLFTQMVCFLHLGRESTPRWNAYAFAFAVTVVIILVIGSLWIMSNLNYRMLESPTAINRYLNGQGDL